MESHRKPLSIRVIYWITQVAFWLLVVAGGVGTLISIALLFGYRNPDLNLHMQAPFVFEVLEHGRYLADGEVVDLHLTGASGRISFEGTPAFIARPVAVAIILVIVMAVLAMLQFRRFIANVYQGRYFDRKNIRCLKNMSWWIVGIWLAMKLYLFTFYLLIIKKIEFSTIRPIDNFDVGGELFLLALFVYVLSHIFQKGLELEEEHKLTV